MDQGSTLLAMAMKYLPRNNNVKNTRILKSTHIEFTDTNFDIDILQHILNSKLFLSGKIRKKITVS